ncbi:MAG: gfo/Idh/MocA family oxidoreductase [Flavobacteriales bacterium]|nr:gfo/Idh/MocA family oxidoreductase [Flavobacteriales bacterium]NCA20205.1 gfo/Idh/MocA family oxidoreductase [Crocinitomicaceae bacterium]
MQKLLLVGTGYMGKAYATVLKKLNIEFDAVCMSEQSAISFSKEFECTCLSGGIESIDFNKHKYNSAIIAIGIENLKSACEKLINNRIKYILIEKPAGLNSTEIIDLNDFALNSSCQVFVAYNRRFYASVLKAKEIIESDGGILSGNFEFTEWSQKIAPLQKAEGVKENWFLANSTHVVDLAFFLMGKPKEMHSFTSGKIDWHSPAIFSGSGKTNANVIFSYNANWLSAGRWRVEVLTTKRKLILAPMEELQEQLVNSIEVRKVENIDYSIDSEFKPGIFLQTKAFVEQEFDKLKTLQEQTEDLIIYDKILGK